MPLPKSHVWLSFWPGSCVFLLFLVFLIYLGGCSVWWIINLVFCCSYSQCPSHTIIYSSERGGGGSKTGSEWKNIGWFIIHSVWHFNNGTSLVTLYPIYYQKLRSNESPATRSSLPPWPWFLKRGAENVSEHPSSNHTGSIQMLHLL